MDFRWTCPLCGKCRHGNWPEEGASLVGDIVPLRCPEEFGGCGKTPVMKHLGDGVFVFTGTTMCGADESLGAEEDL